MSSQDNAAEAAAITAGAKSNLAFALACLPKERREDMVSFYAFCRVVDDIADEPGMPDDERRAGLARWEKGLVEGFEDSGPIEAETERLREKYGIDTELFVEVVRGVGMDIGGGRRFETFDELKEYCYRVACAVGLASVKIFGARSSASEEYAINLGYALQLTNILRDVGEDAAEGRIYLPLEDLRRHGVGEADLLERKGGERFVELMAFEAERAEEFYRAAEAGMPAEDRRALRAAHRMGKIYRGILRKMSRDGFKVYDRRYRLGKLRMLAILLGL